MAKIHIQGGASDEFFESAAYSLVPKHMKKRKGGIGKREKDNGLLILFVLDQRKISFETGYGMEGTAYGLCPCLYMRDGALRV